LSNIPKFENSTFDTCLSAKGGGGLCLIIGDYYSIESTYYSNRKKTNDDINIILSAFNCSFSNCESPSGGGIKIILLSSSTQLNIVVFSISKISFSKCIASEGGSVYCSIENAYTPLYQSPPSIIRYNYPNTLNISFYEC
jgi:hypothetical protein